MQYSHPQRGQTSFEPKFNISAEGGSVTVGVCNLRSSDWVRVFLRYNIPFRNSQSKTEKICELRSQSFSDEAGVVGRGVRPRL